MVEKERSFYSQLQMSDAFKLKELAIQAGTVKAALKQKPKVLPPLKCHSVASLVQFG